MAIKKLQNNFTSPEQSKRLLDIGVPADSTDCFYSNTLGNWYLDIIPQYKNYTSISNGMDDLYLPCWSVGRLIEIWETIAPFRFKRGKGTLLEDIITKIEASIKYNGLDFSKLEE